MMCSDPRKAASASGRSNPCVSEITPMTIGILGSRYSVLTSEKEMSQRFSESLARIPVSNPKHSSGLRRSYARPPRFNPIQRLPQHVRRFLGGVQGSFCHLRLSRDPLLKLVAPHARVIHVSGRMQRKIPARLVVPAIHLPQAPFFFLRDPRHLRLVRVKRGQR